MTDASNRVLVLAVHWHDAPAVQALAARIAREPDAFLAVADNSGDWAGAVPPKTLVVQPPGNLGYFNGCAFARAAFCKTHPPPRWTVVANTDVVLAPDFFETLRGTRWPDDAGVLAPHIADADGRAQNPFLPHRPSRAWLERRGRWLRRPLVQHFVHSPFYGLWRRRRAASSPGPMRPIYAPYGAALVFGQCFFERGGRLAYGGFLFGEEIHVAEQVRRAGLAVYFAPMLHATHHGGQSTTRTPARARARWHEASNRWLLDTYFRPDDPF